MKMFALFTNKGEGAAEGCRSESAAFDWRRARTRRLERPAGDCVDEDKGAKKRR